MNATKQVFNYRRHTATTRTATKPTVTPLLIMAGLAALASSFLQVPRCSESTGEIQATPRMLSNQSGEWWEAQAWLLRDAWTPEIPPTRDYSATQEELDEWPYEPTLKECAENYKKMCAAEQAKREVLKDEAASSRTTSAVAWTPSPELGKLLIQTAKTLEAERTIKTILYQSKDYTQYIPREPVFIPVTSGGTSSFTVPTTIAEIV